MKWRRPWLAALYFTLAAVIGVGGYISTGQVPAGWERYLTAFSVVIVATVLLVLGFAERLD